MPRRFVNKCPVRGATADQLEAVAEMNLTDGECFGCFDFDTHLEFSRPWSIWREEITRRWIAGFPGSRPMAAYILGEIEPPTWLNKWPILRRPLRPIRGVDVRIADCGWHKTVHELEHLDRLGLVDNEEWNAAVDRLDRRDWRDYTRYVQIAGD